MDMAKFGCKNCGEPFEAFIEFAPYLPPECPTCGSRYVEYLSPDNVNGSPPTRQKKEKTKKNPAEI